MEKKTGKEQWKVNCFLYDKVSSMDVVLVSLESMGNALESTGKMELLWKAIVRWDFPFLVKENLHKMIFEKLSVNSRNIVSS